MLDIRDLQCVVALYEFRHFARAASACGLSQPAFSMRISNLEKSLNITIVKRGNRFHDFTPEGDAIVAKARDVLERIEDLENRARIGRGEMSGALILGVIPTAVAHAANAAIWMRQRHEDVRIRIVTANSLSVQQGLEDGRFDLGMTYTEGVSSDLLRIDPVFQEEYVALVPKSMSDGGEDAITWAQVSALPLALLEPSMQNRRILNHIFDEVGVRPDVPFESNGFNAAMVAARSGVAATIVPKVLIEELGDLKDVVVKSLTEPDVIRSVSLVSPYQTRKFPLVNAFREIVLAHAPLSELIEPS
ncbi:MAG: LysR family transcriptional regulator [Pseudomonadota bacterium]